MEKELGLVSVSFRQHSPEEIVRAAAAAGLRCIEWGSDVHAPCRDFQRLDEIVQLQEQAGLSCCSYGTYFRLGENDPAELPDYIRAAKRLGTNLLRLWCGSRGSRDYEPEEKRKLLEQCRLAARIAEDNGAVLAMECHNGTLTDWKEGAAELMETVASPAFRMYYQPNQFRSVEENLAYARLLAPYTTQIHVFNWEERNRYPLKEAVETWKQYLSCFGGHHCLLLEFMPDNRLESLPAEAEALREIAGLL